ncbi:unnamed protein product [Spirodela intermedia]|uniref:Uncharacterized protein n=1 Tax=Spirodela intermedia TaxID=51605 RepID=A0A7I8IJR5_SPIIN|nr:unnamed protein product [Spirodela intermedia]CAA6658078.1 unnamed protein product [Spirodela intermedia]
MATGCKIPVAASAAVLLQHIGAAVVAPASASTVTVYPRTGCGGKGRTWGCDQFYHGWNCQGSHDTIRGNVRRCSAHGYISVHIIC